MTDMTSDNPARLSVSSEKDRSDGAASGHGRRKPWTAPHLKTVGVADFGAAAGGASAKDGTTCYTS